MFCTNNVFRDIFCCISLYVLLCLTFNYTFVNDKVDALPKFGLSLKIKKVVDGTFDLKELDKKILLEPEKISNYQKKELKQCVFRFGNTSIRMFGTPSIDCSILFIGIHSGPDNVDRRNGIRETYMKNPQDGVCHRFILGNPTKELYEESEAYKDIVFIDQLERYKKMSSILPYKTAAIFNLGVANRIKPKWLLKVDDDSFVNVNKWLEILPKLSDDHVYGKCVHGFGPIRDSNSLWYINETMWPSNLYPPFCYGAGYLLPLRAAVCGAKVIAESTFRYFPLEDVFTGIIMKKCNITTRKLEKIENGSKHSVGNLINHYLKTSEAMKGMWNLEECLLKPDGINCLVKSRKRKKLLPKYKSVIGHKIELKSHKSS